MERVESKELQLRVNLLGVGVSRVHTLFNQTDVVCMQTCLSRLAICKKKLRPIPLTPEEDREWQDSLTVCKNKKKKKDCEREVDKIVLDIAKFDVTHLKPLHYGGL